MAVLMTVGAAASFYGAVLVSAGQPATPLALGLIVLALLLGLAGILARGRA